MLGKTARPFARPAARPRGKSARAHEAGRTAPPAPRCKMHKPLKEQARGAFPRRFRRHFDPSQEANGAFWRGFDPSEGAKSGFSRPVAPMTDGRSAPSARAKRSHRWLKRLRKSALPPPSRFSLHLLAHGRTVPRPYSPSRGRGPIGQSPQSHMQGGSFHQLRRSPDFHRSKNYPLRARYRRPRPFRCSPIADIVGTMFRPRPWNFGRECKRAKNPLCGQASRDAKFDQNLIQPRHMFSLANDTGVSSLSCAEFYVGAPNGMSDPQGTAGSGSGGKR